MSEKRSVNEIQRDNYAHFMERGPAISHGYSAFVIARDPDKGGILLGGLGGLGVGQMWTYEREDHRDYAGYAEAEIVAAPGGQFGL